MLKVAFQTAETPEKNRRNGTVTLLINELAIRNVSEIYCYPTIDVVLEEKTPFANGSRIKLMGDYDLDYKVLEKCRINLNHMDVIFIRGDDIESNPDILDVFNHLDSGTFVLNPPGPTIATKDKFVYKRFSEQLPMPQTFHATNYEELCQAVESITTNKVVLKERYGFGGKQVEFVEKDDRELGAKLAKMIEKYHELVVQEYVPSAEYGDIRIVMLDGKILNSMWRVPPEGGWKANISCGGSGRRYELEKDEEDLSTKVAELYSDAPFIGVDLLKGPCGPYFVELNAFPGMEGLNEAYGIKHERIVLDWVLSKLNKLNSINRKLY